MSEFVEYLNEVFERFGPVRSRKMFGGYGIYHNGLMFGLVASDELYLKADKDSDQYFEALGMHQFEYTKSERKMKLSYCLAPEEIFEDPETTKTWAQRAYGAASRAKKPKKRPTKCPNR